MRIYNHVPVLGRENFQWRQSAEARYVLLETGAVILTKSLLHSET